VLSGILSRKKETTVIRIDRAGNTNSVRVLNAERLNEVLVDPLLSSSRVFEGLFYPGAVVVEADSDARFYKTTSDLSGVRGDLHFVNADNKQTVPRILRVYREMGVRCAGIVDFDVLNDSSEFSQQLDAIGMDTADAGEVLDIQRKISDAVISIGPDERLSQVSVIQYQHSPSANAQRIFW
jgi:hypothetical protein